MDAGVVGRAFEPKTAFGFAVLVGVLLVLAAAVRDRLGAPGILVGAAVTGFADAHTSAIAIAGLVATGKIPASEVTLPILVAVSTNCVSKIVIAWWTGGPAFAKPVVLVVLAALVAAWAGALLWPFS